MDFRVDFQGDPTLPLPACTAIGQRQLFAMSGQETKHFTKHVEAELIMREHDLGKPSSKEMCDLLVTNFLRCSLGNGNEAQRRLEETKHSP